MKGLIGRARLEAGEGLLLRAKRVHTFGMRFAIDVVFCDREGQVLKVYRNLEPGKISARIRGARSVLELGAGAAESVTQGDVVEFLEIHDPAVSAIEIDERFAFTDIARDDFRDHHVVVARIDGVLRQTLDPRERAVKERRARLSQAVGETVERLVASRREVPSDGFLVEAENVDGEASDLSDEGECAGTLLERNQDQRRL
jgi:uncharacterized membrane protein (UPF0127 family)